MTIQDYLDLYEELEEPEEPVAVSPITIDELLPDVRTLADLTAVNDIILSCRIAKALDSPINCSTFAHIRN